MSSTSHFDGETVNDDGNSLCNSQASCAGDELGEEYESDNVLV